MSKLVIKNDGLVGLNVGSYGVSTVLVGSLEGATLTLGYVVKDTFYPLANGVLAQGSQQEVRHGLGNEIYVQASGVTTEIELLVGGIA